MAQQYGIRHRDGRWLVGWTATRSPRMIWTDNPREAYGCDKPEAERQAALLAKYRKPIQPGGHPIPAT